MAALTPSDGVHLYLLKGDDGPSITNRGNLPEHVDVRGLGGYVIAPPSVMSDGRRATAGIGKEPIGGIAKAPSGCSRCCASAAERPFRRETLITPRKVNSVENSKSQLTADDAVRKYALAALDGELQAVRSAPSGQRNAQLNESALKIASLVAAGALEATLARSLLEAAARDNPGRDDDRQLRRRSTAAGQQESATLAISARSRPQPVSAASGIAGGASGLPPRRAQACPPRRCQSWRATLPNGRCGENICRAKAVEDASEADTARLGASPPCGWRSASTRQG
jgi:putative DNA primase/helicase